jgi:hypothetical protein
MNLIKTAGHMEAKHGKFDSLKNLIYLTVTFSVKIDQQELILSEYMCHLKTKRKKRITQPL